MASRRRRRRGRDRGVDSDDSDAEDPMDAIRSRNQARAQRQIDRTDDRQNTDILNNAIRMATESATIGAETLNTLEQQSEQMHRIDGHMNDINQSLARSERRIANMMSIRTAIVNSWRDPPVEKDRTYAGPVESMPDPAEQKQQKQQEIVKTDIIDIPEHVVWGTKLQERKMQKKLSDKGRIKFNSGEELLYFYVNSKKASFMISDETENCVLLTTERIVKIEEGKVDTEMYFNDVKSVTHIKNGAFKRDKISCSFLDPSKKDDTIGVASRDTCAFFVKSIDICVEQAALNKIQGDETFAEENKQLDVLGRLMDDLHMQGQQMNTELRNQHHMLNHLNNQMDETTERFKKNQNDINGLLNG